MNFWPVQPLPLLREPQESDAVVVPDAKQGWRAGAAP